MLAQLNTGKYLYYLSKMWVGGLHQRRHRQGKKDMLKYSLMLLMVKCNDELGAILN